MDVKFGGKQNCYIRRRQHVLSVSVLSVRIWHRVAAHEALFPKMSLTDLESLRAARRVYSHSSQAMRLAEGVARREDASVASARAALEEALAAASLAAAEVERAREERDEAALMAVRGRIGVRREVREACIGCGEAKRKGFECGGCGGFGCRLGCGGLGEWCQGEGCGLRWGCGECRQSGEWFFWKCVGHDGKDCGRELCEGCVDVEARGCKGCGVDNVCRRCLKDGCAVVEAKRRRKIEAKEEGTGTLWEGEAGKGSGRRSARLNQVARKDCR